MVGGPELFVVCKSCGSEVSPYVTECPYCGARVRKRAPKLDGGAPRRPRIVKPKLSPLRHGEIPGVSAGTIGTPYATVALVAISLLGYLVLTVVVDPLWQVPVEGYGRLAYAPFVYASDQGWYELAVLLPIAVFGWRLELRHGPAVVIALFILGGFVATALAVWIEPGRFPLGAPGAAMAMLGAWIVPDLWRLRSNREYDGDLIGAAVIAAVLGLMPLVESQASAIATYAGLVAGLLAGHALSRTEGAR